MSTSLYSPAMTTTEQPAKRQRIASGDVQSSKALPLHDVDLSTVQLRPKGVPGETKAYEPLISGSQPNLLLTPDGTWLTPRFKMCFAKAYSLDSISGDVNEGEGELVVNLTPEIDDIWRTIDSRFSEECAKHDPNTLWKSAAYIPASGERAPCLKLRVKLHGDVKTSIVVQRLDGSIEKGCGSYLFKSHCVGRLNYQVYAEIKLLSTRYQPNFDSTFAVGLAKPLCTRLLLKEITDLKKPKHQVIDWDDDEVRCILEH